MPEKLLLWPTAICHISLFCRTPLKLWFSDCATGCRRHYTACFTDPIELFITCKVTFCVKLMEVPFNKINSELKKKTNGFEMPVVSNWNEVCTRQKEIKMK